MLYETTCLQHFFFFALKGILLQHDSRIIVAVDILFIFFC